MNLSSEPAIAMSNTATTADLYSRAMAGTAVSWGAIFAGAAATAALSLILLVLGAGFGLSSISPWAQAGISAATFGFGTILWLTLTQLLASGMGGYLAGRLRTKWASVHADEVHFRDTAHGFLSWAVATCVTAAVLTTAIGAIVGSGARTAATGAAAVTSAQGDDAAPAANDRTAYFVRTLLRNNAPTADGASALNTLSAAPAAAESSALSERATVAEVTGIFTNATRAGALPDQDSEYLGLLVSRRTGLPPADAQTRVRDTFSRLQNQLRDDETAAKAAADKARKAGAYGSLWLFISLLLGAFSASLAATFGGRERDL